LAIAHPENPITWTISIASRTNCVRAESSMPIHVISVIARMKTAHSASSAHVLPARLSSPNSEYA
jgi:hypothetical protein